MLRLRLEIKAISCRHGAADEQVQDITERRMAEQALRESEERLRSLAMLSSDWYWEQDEHFRFTAFPGAERAGPWRHEQTLGIGQRRWDLHGFFPLRSVRRGRALSRLPGHGSRHQPGREAAGGLPGHHGKQSRRRSDAFFTVDRRWRPDLQQSIFVENYQRAMNENVAVQFEAFYAPFGVWVQIKAYPSRQGLAIYARDVTERIAAQQEILRLNAELEQRVKAHALAGGVRGHRYRPGHRPQDRHAPWRPHLGRVGARAGRDVLLHTEPGQPLKPRQRMRCTESGRGTLHAHNSDVAQMRHVHKRFPLETLSPLFLSTVHLQ